MVAGYSAGAPDSLFVWFSPSVNYRFCAENLSSEGIDDQHACILIALTKGQRVETSVSQSSYGNNLNNLLDTNVSSYFDLWLRKTNKPYFMYLFILFPLFDHCFLTLLYSQRLNKNNELSSVGSFLFSFVPYALFSVQISFNLNAK